KSFLHAASVWGRLYIIAVLISGSRSKPPYNWVLFALMFSMFATPLANTKAIMHFIPHDQLRHKLTFYALIFAGFSFSYGRTEAFKILENPDVTVDVVMSKLDGLSKNPSDIAYLGYVGDRYFLYDRTTSQIVIVLASSIPNLHLAIKKSAFLPFDWSMEDKKEQPKGEKSEQNK
ncbi:hypothetical protein, partial [Herbaspirillum sp. VT-16-41]|uniref:hypothetical protein n=1 Tax=Herbaspirillum sp. VT-16-41 TaxID=1953765 RepID=UPI00143DEF3C